LTKIGTGALTLSGRSTYLGPTAVNAGTPQAGAMNVFAPNRGFTVASGATLARDAWFGHADDRQRRDLHHVFWGDLRHQRLAPNNRRSGPAR
jgi:autotransporter-associated beta strand protein